MQNPFRNWAKSMTELYASIVESPHCERTLAKTLGNKKLSLHASVNVYGKNAGRFSTVGISSAKLDELDAAL
jgi:hypothetical protein